MSQKLKPCPFCGHEEPEFERLGTGRQSCIVACGNCGARHESSDTGDRNGSSWNERAAPPAQEPMVWHLSKDGLPPVGSEVIGGHFYKDTWLKGNPEVFAWGRCKVFKAEDDEDFPDGKQWHTFGPSHNQITHWCWPPQKPGAATPECHKRRDEPCGCARNAALCDGFGPSAQPAQHEDTARLNWMQANLLRKSSMRIEGSMQFQTVNAWAIASAGTDLREAVDVVRKGGKT